MKAEKGQLFSRAAKQSAECLENLAELVENLIANRIIQLIGLSRKSGQCICGYEKVKDWLKKDIVKVLIQSSDGSNRGKSRLRIPDDGKFIGCLSSKELGKAFGTRKYNTLRTSIWWFNSTYSRRCSAPQRIAHRKRSKFFTKG